MQRGVERVPDVKVFTFLTQVGWTQPHRKKHAFQRIDDLRERFAPRQFAPARLERALLHFAPLLADRLKRVDNFIDIKHSHSGYSP
jgi:hypothetical protein